VNAPQARRSPARRPPARGTLRPPANRAQHLRSVPPPEPRRGRRRLPFLIAAFALTTILVVGVVSIQVMVAQTSFRMQELQRRNELLEQRYDELRLEVARLSAPDRIEREARRIGFVYPEPGDVHTIVVRTRPKGGNAGGSSLFAIEQLLGSVP
jgi:cell division protein FtsL